MKEKELVKNYLKEYGNTMRELREAKGYKQLQVAKRVYCSQAIISHIENGLFLPDADLEKALLDVYGGKIK